MKIIKLIFVLLTMVLSNFAKAESGSLKIINPNKNSEVYVLTDTSCGNTVSQAHNEKALEFGIGTEKNTYAKVTTGCYDLNDKEKIITFFYKDRKVINISYEKIQALDIETGKQMISTSYYTPIFSSVWGRVAIRSEQWAQMKKLRNEGSTVSSKQSPVIPMSEQEARQFIKQKISTGNVIGSVYDSAANAEGKLYDIACFLPALSNKYSYFWASIKRSDGDLYNFGCYNNDTSNKNIVMFFAGDNMEKTLPSSIFGIGTTNQLESKCDSYGFQRGTTAYSQCLMNIEQQNNQAAYQQSLQMQQNFKNAAELLRGDGRTPGSTNCYKTPGVPNSVYCQ